MTRFLMLAVFIATTTLISLEGSVAQAATMLNVDNGNLSCNDLSGTPFCTIQAAIDAASSNDSIQVAEGTYIEQVEITKTLKLIGNGASTTTIRAPTTLVGDKSIVTISGTTVKAEITGFTISGPGSGTCDSNSIRYGVFVQGNANGNIHHNIISDIRDEPLSGCQHGLAILVGRDSVGTSGTATIRYNTISGYQKGGIVIDGPGSYADVRNNEVIGEGEVTNIAQNGIQLSRTAGAAVHNNLVNGNWFTGADWTASGILLFETNDVTVQGNTVINSQTSVAIEAWCWQYPSASGNKVVNNTIENSDYGVSVAAYDLSVWFGSAFTNCDAEANNNKITNNQITATGGETGVFVGADALGGLFSPTAVNNKIIHNTISGFTMAIDDTGTSSKLHANVIDP